MWNQSKGCKQGYKCKRLVNSQLLASIFTLEGYYSCSLQLPSRVTFKNMNTVINRAHLRHTHTHQPPVIFIQAAFNMGYVWCCVGWQPDVQSIIWVLKQNKFIDSGVRDSDTQGFGFMFACACFFMFVCVQITHQITAVTLWPKGWQCFTPILVASLPNPNLGSSPRGELGQSVVVLACC